MVDPSDAVRIYINVGPIYGAEETYIPDFRSRRLAGPVFPSGLDETMDDRG